MFTFKAFSINSLRILTLCSSLSSLSAADPFAVWVAVTPGVPFGSTSYQGGISISYLAVEDPETFSWDRETAKDRIAIDKVELFLPSGFLLDTLETEPGIYPADFVLDTAIGLSQDWQNVLELPNESTHDGARSVEFDFPVNVLSPNAETTENSHFGEGDSVWITFDTDRSGVPVGEENYIANAIVYPGDLVGAEVRITLVDRATDKTFVGSGVYAYDAEFDFYGWETLLTDPGGNPVIWDSIPILIQPEEMEDFLVIKEVDGTVIQSPFNEDIGMIGERYTRTFQLHNTSRIAVYVTDEWTRFLKGWAPYDVVSGNSYTDDFIRVDFNWDWNEPIGPGETREMTLSVDPPWGDWVKFFIELRHSSKVAGPVRFEFAVNAASEVFDPLESGWYPFAGEWNAMVDGWGTAEYLGFGTYGQFPSYWYSQPLGWISPAVNYAPYEFVHASSNWIFTGIFGETGYYFDFSDGQWKSVDH